MANKLYFNKSLGSYIGCSTQDSNVVQNTSVYTSVEVDNSTMNQIIKGYLIPQNYNGSSVTYFTYEAFKSIDAATAQEINNNTFVAPQGDNSNYPISKKDFEHYSNQICASLQEALSFEPNHPLTSQANAYINYLKAINLDTITWPLSKFVNEYALDNGQTVILSEEII